MNYLKLVEELNQELFDNHGGDLEQFFYTASGFIDIIGFGDIHLWNSEDDGREWLEDVNEYEPLKQYVKNELKSIGQKLVKYSL